MMGGLAYMTGRPGHPSRAGASVNDIMGEVFGALAILAALRHHCLAWRQAVKDPCSRRASVT